MRLALAGSTLAAVWLSCHRDHEPPVALEAPPSSVSAAVSASTATPAASASAAPVMDPSSVAKRWSDALNTSDTTTLSSLYADRVKYYGVSFDRAALVKKVSETLAKKPYHQQIKDVSHWRVKNGIRVQFHKSFGSRTEAGGYLVLDEKTLRIIEESDMTTDDTLLLAGKCIPYFETTTVTGELSHASGPPTDDFWVIALDTRVCLVDGDGGRTACDLPEATGKLVGALPESKSYSMSGTFVPAWRHQMCGFDITSARAIQTTP